MSHHALATEIELLCRTWPGCKESLVETIAHKLKAARACEHAVAHAARLEWGHSFDSPGNPVTACKHDTQRCVQSYSETATLVQRRLEWCGTGGELVEDREWNIPLPPAIEPCC